MKLFALLICFVQRKTNEKRTQEPQRRAHICMYPLFLSLSHPRWFIDGWCSLLVLSGRQHLGQEQVC